MIHKVHFMTVLPLIADMCWYAIQRSFARYGTSLTRSKLSLYALCQYVATARFGIAKAANLVAVEVLCSRNWSRCGNSTLGGTANGGNAAVATLITLVFRIPLLLETATVMLCNFYPASCLHHWSNSHRLFWKFWFQSTLLFLQLWYLPWYLGSWYLYH